MINNRTVTQHWVINILVVLGFVFTVSAAYPGFMSYDSLDQYSQAKSNIFTDWHPPFMAWFWSKLILIKDGPVLMLFLFNLLYWASVGSIALKLRHFYLSLIFIVLSFAPSLINFLGVIWKDTFLMTLLLFQCALLFRLNEKSINNYKKTSISALLLIINFVAILLRHNAVTALLPLLILCIIQLFPQKKIIYSLITGTILTVALFFLGQKANNAICKDEHLHPEQQLMIFDLMGISDASNQNLMPDYLKPKLTLDSIHRHYFYSSGGLYVIFSMHCNTADVEKLSQLKEAWIAAIKQYPNHFLKHKYLVFKYLQSHSNLVTYNMIDNNPYGIKLEPNPVRDVFVNYTEGGFAKSFYKAKYYTWICLITMLLSLILCAKSQKYFYPFFVSLSGILYSSTYFLLSPTSDLRYNYWTIAAALLGMLSFLHYCLDKKKKA